jgi:hypothetical protein
MARQEILMTVTGDVSDLEQFWAEWDATMAAFGLIISEIRVLHGPLDRDDQDQN